MQDRNIARRSWYGALWFGFALAAIAGLSHSAEAKVVPGVYAFDPPSGWNESEQLLRSTAGTPGLTSAFAYLSDDLRVFAIFEFALPATMSARAEAGGFLAGYLEGAAGKHTFRDKVQTESSTTIALSFVVDSDGITSTHRCSSWVGSDALVHGVCGVCAESTQSRGDCTAALESIRVIAPQADRRPLGRSDDRRSAAYNVGYMVGRLCMVVMLLSLLVGALYAALRRTRR